MGSGCSCNPKLALTEHDTPGLGIPKQSNSLHKACAVRHCQELLRDFRGAIRACDEVCGKHGRKTLSPLLQDVLPVRFGVKGPAIGGVDI